jgi:F0F1-type ATP synthase membrane subunit b/b'
MVSFGPANMVEKYGANAAYHRAQALRDEAKEYFGGTRKQSNIIIAAARQRLRRAEQRNEVSTAMDAARDIATEQDLLAEIRLTEQATLKNLRQLVNQLRHRAIAG